MREKFLLDKDLVFLNHGSFGACPKEIFENYQYWQTQLERNPVDFTARQLPDLLKHSRKSLASFLGTSAEQLVFTNNASTGINTIARSVDFAAGDEVLVSSHTYGAVVRTWHFLMKEKGISLKTFEIPFPYSADEMIDNLKSALTEKTRLVCLDHIPSMSAVELPVAEIGAMLNEMGVLTLIDGAHAPGQIDLRLDSLNVDFYVGNLHKWMCMPKGSAFMWTKGSLEDLKPLVVSWGYESREDYIFHGVHEWQGTRDHSAFLTVQKTVDFRKQNKWEEHQLRCRELCLSFRDTYNRRYGKEPLVSDKLLHQMVSVELPASTQPKAFQNELFKKYRVEVNCDYIKEMPVLRVSCQVYNDEQDIAKAVDAISGLLS